MRKIKNERNRTELNTRTRLRKIGTALFGAALGFSITASALAADAVTLRVGDQKGGNRSLLEIAGLAKDLPYRIEWSEFPAAAPILEALNAGARRRADQGDRRHPLQCPHAGDPGSQGFADQNGGRP